MFNFCCSFIFISFLSTYFVYGALVEDEKNLHCDREKIMASLPFTQPITCLEIFSRQRFFDSHKRFLKPASNEVFSYFSFRLLLNYAMFGPTSRSPHGIVVSNSQPIEPYTNVVIKDDKLPLFIKKGIVFAQFHGPLESNDISLNKDGRFLGYTSRHSKKIPLFLRGSSDKHKYPSILEIRHNLARIGLDYNTLFEYELNASGNETRPPNMDSSDILLQNILRLQYNYLVQKATEKYLEVKDSKADVFLHDSDLMLKLNALIPFLAPGPAKHLIIKRILIKPGMLIKPCTPLFIASEINNVSTRHLNKNKNKDQLLSMADVFWDQPLYSECSYAHVFIVWVRDIPEDKFPFSYFYGVDEPLFLGYFVTNESSKKEIQKSSAKKETTKLDHKLYIEKLMKMMQIDKSILSKKLQEEGKEISYKPPSNYLVEYYLKMVHEFDTKNSQGT